METTPAFDPLHGSLHERIGSILKQQIGEIMVDIDPSSLSMNSSMRELGLNSIDRVDVIMNTLELLGQNVPLVNFASARTLGDIVKIIGDRHVTK